MSIIVSLQVPEVVVVSDELRRLVLDAYAKRGVGVKLPAEAVKRSCAELSSQTTEEILKIRRHERTVSSQTLAFSFA